MAGFGTIKYGSGLFGLGAPGAGTEIPAGTTTFCRFINPATRDYEQDSATLHLRQTTSVQQRVILALTMIRSSSSALPDFGIQLSTRMDGRYAQRVRAEVRAALRQMTDVERVIAIESIDIERGMTRAAITVVYRNLQTGETESAVA